MLDSNITNRFKHNSVEYMTALSLLAALASIPSANAQPLATVDNTKVGNDNSIVKALEKSHYTVIGVNSQGVETPKTTFDTNDNSVIVEQKTIAHSVLQHDLNNSLEVHNDIASIDYSGQNEGYISMNYVGDKSCKIRIKNPDGTYYTYSGIPTYQYFPLTSGSGTYTVTMYESIDSSDPNAYQEILSCDITADIQDELKPFLYSNQYTDFDDDSVSTVLADEICDSAQSTSDAVERILTYVADTIDYDYDLASKIDQGTLQMAYVPNPSQILAEKKGICLDYASLSVAMLRSQGIPCKMEVGYAGDTYHAWISVYENGEWVKYDPTLMSTGESNEGVEYTVAKIY